MAALDLRQKRFGRLTAIERSFGKAPNGSLLWRCACDCGNEHVTSADGLTSGKCRSCGCLQQETRSRAGKRKLRHGHAVGRGSREYCSWRQMLDRCNNPKHHAFRLYGGRGVLVDERWTVFENFLADMGLRPEGKSLDRINPDGNYGPNNCRWATPLEQTLNRRAA